MLLFDRGASFTTCIQSGIVGTALAFSLNAACRVPLARPAQTIARPAPQATLASAPIPAFEPEPELHPTPAPPVDCAVVACLALTFDDGPDSRTTPQLLDTLAAHEVKATFFMLGSQVIKYPDIARRVEKAGHEIGNHSWVHADYDKLQPQQMVDDIAHTQKTFADAGVEPPRLFRPPFGARTPVVRQSVSLSLAYWNVDPKDWNAKDPAQLADAVVASAKPGAIVVLHDIKPVTVAAAPQFIARLKQHYKLVTVSELMGLPPQSPKIEIFGRL